MVEIEVLLAQSLGWSLHDIDETDAGNLMDFVAHLTGRRETAKGGRRVYIDQVDWQ